MQTIRSFEGSLPIGKMAFYTGKSGNHKDKPILLAGKNCESMPCFNPQWIVDCNALKTPKGNQHINHWACLTPLFNDCPIINGKN